MTRNLLSIKKNVLVCIAKTEKSVYSEDISAVIKKV